MPEYCDLVEITNNYRLTYFPNSINLDIEKHKQSPKIEILLYKARELLNGLSSPGSAMLSRFIIGLLNLCFYFTLKSSPTLWRNLKHSGLSKADLALVNQMVSQIDKLNLDIFTIETTESKLSDLINKVAYYPLIMTESCVPNTLAVYFRYIKTVNDLAIIPVLPISEPKRFAVESPFKVKLMWPQLLPIYEKRKLSDEEALHYLKCYVSLATDMYVKYSNNIWFSLFHFHGQTGRNRAKDFVKKFTNITDYGEAMATLVKYLQDPKMGNTHPHSYRTMLLSTLLGNEYHTYSDVSSGYDNKLTGFINENPQPSNRPKL